MKELTDYLHKAHRSPLWTLRRNLVLSADKIFSELKKQIPNPPLHERVRRYWIYDETWASIDARVTALREGAQKTVWQLIQHIYAWLSMDRKRRAD